MRPKIHIDIKSRLFASIILISLLPVAIVSYIAYTNYIKLMDRQVATVTSSLMETSIGKIDAIMNEIELVASALVYQQNSATSNASVQLLDLDSYITDFDDYRLLTARRDFQTMAESILYSHSYIEGVYIFTVGGNVIDYTKTSAVRLGYKPAESEWYARTKDLKGELYKGETTVQDFLLEHKSSISFSQVMYDFATRKELGVVLINCSTDMFGDIGKTDLKGLNEMVLVNSKGTVLYGDKDTRTGESLEPALLREIEGNEGSFLSDQGKVRTVFRSFPDSDWKIVASLEVNPLKREMLPTLQWMIGVSAACLVFAIVISFTISNTFTRPIIQLSKMMRKDQLRPAAAKRSYMDRNNEIGILYREYHSMLEEINRSIKERYENKLIVLDSQMKALEAQINSHFLYNTLESINSLAEIEGIDTISRMVNALGDMFRYSIKTDSELVQLQEEIVHVQNYLTIQKIRYEDKIEYAFDISEAILRIPILKLVLQPLVENALLHGIEPLDRPGEIRISGWADEEDLIFRIEDNGVGMSSEQLQEMIGLLKAPPEFNLLGKRNQQSIGIKNVHSRIELYYGKNYGIHALESEPNKGTSVTVRIPRNPSAREEERHV